MKARYAYPLLFFLPSAMVASIAAVVCAGVGAGVVWLFIHGDDSWPGAVERTIMGVSALVAVTSFAALISASYLYGKRRESVGLSKWHAAAALASTIVLPALVLLRQFRIGALG